MKRKPTFLDWIKTILWCLLAWFVINVDDNLEEKYSIPQRVVREP